MIFNTLNSIIDDILNEARSNNISESESLNRKQIEQWIIQYRAFLIKQDIDKGRGLNQDYIQEIKNIKLIQSSIVSPSVFANSSYKGPDAYKLVTSITIPKTLDFNSVFGLTSVTDLLGNDIQITTEARSNKQKNRRYVHNDYVAYQSEDRIKLDGPGELEYINVKGVFVNPLEAIPNATGDENYPIPENMIPLLKELIFAKEFKFSIPVDNSNNSKNDTENASVSKG